MKHRLSRDAVHGLFIAGAATTIVTTIAIMTAILAACDGSPQNTEVPSPTSTVSARSSCFWVGPYNVAMQDTEASFYDAGASYWTSNFNLPKGAAVELHGRFPHARYLSYVIYNSAQAPIDVLHDSALQADAGSVNPFITGNPRNDAGRDYRFRIVGDAPPADASQRVPNTLYADVPDGGTVSVFYRLYVTDAGSDVTGGAGLPTIELETADGGVQPQTQACSTLAASQDLAAGSVPPEWEYRLGRDQPLRQQTFPADNPPVWHAYYNEANFISCTYFNACGRHPQRTGGVYNNPDNGYLTAMINRGYAPVLVLHGTLPVTPATVDGESTMGDGELRYWSMCEYETYTQKTSACLYDEQLPIDAQRRYTIVVSRPQDRPVNATADCGVAYLAWSPAGDGEGHSDDGVLFLRNLLPAAGFTQAAQNTSTPGDESAVLGAYLPSGEYVDKAGFEVRGCPVVVE